jgi:hypothetical protein
MVPEEIAEGLFHWTAVHPEIGIRVHSYYLAKERVVLDPLLPGPRGLVWLKTHGPPEHIILTSRLHSRDSAKLVEAFGCTVWANRKGLFHLAPELGARGFDAGDTLLEGIRAVEIGGLCPDESALVLASVRAAAVGDGVVRSGSGPLTFVEDELLVDDPRDASRVKRELRVAYWRLTEQPWDHLLMAHGEPWLNEGRQALREWARHAQDVGANVHPGE